MFLKTVLLDLDGVIYDFVGAVDRVFGSNMSALEKMDYDVSQALGFETQEQFWQALFEKSPDFWESEVKLYPEASQVVEFLKTKCAHLIFCSTAVYSHPLSFAQKSSAIARDFPGAHFMLVSTKENIPYSVFSVLIDDSESNVSYFGSNGILYPRPWNALSEYASNPFEYLKKVLE